MDKKTLKILYYLAWTVGGIAMALLIYGILKNLGVF
jgi:hypothetical protein